MAASSGGCGAPGTPGVVVSASSGASSLAQVEELVRLKKLILKALPAAAEASSETGVGSAVDLGAPPPEASKEAVSALLDALAELETFTVTKALLAKTRIGLTVGALRRHANAEVRSRSGALVAKWKSTINQVTPKLSSSCTSRSGSDAAIATATAAAGGRGATAPAARGEAHPSSGGEAQGAGLGGGAPPAVSSKSSAASSRFVGPFTGDSTRDKARSFLWRALVEGLDGAAAATAGSSSAAETGRVAGAIEAALWQRFVVEKQSTKDYNAQLKTLKWNLADPKNPDLNLKVLWGMYTAEQLATMTSAELASDEKKREREQQKQESLEACQSDWEVRRMITSGEANEGQFPCFKCRTNKTVYFQMQTRSSDEPMTTFVTLRVDCSDWRP
ncbi:hypothetical protein Esti_005329 [Eimeria stiedai]